MRITFRHRAEEDTRFAPTAFDSQVGKTIKYRIGDKVTDATVVAVKVVENGTAVDITIDTPDDDSLRGVTWTPMSFRPVPGDDKLRIPWPSLQPGDLLLGLDGGPRVIPAVGVCGAEYVRPGGRERGDRIVRCDLPSGHEGDHEETDTGSTWASPWPPTP